MKFSLILVCLMVAACNGEKPLASQSCAELGDTAQRIATAFDATCIDDSDCTYVGGAAATCSCSPDFTVDVAVNKSHLGDPDLTAVASEWLTRCQKASCSDDNPCLCTWSPPTVTCGITSKKCTLVAGGCLLHDGGP